jgi:hypothetical protein
VRSIARIYGYEHAHPRNVPKPAKSIVKRSSLPEHFLGAYYTLEATIQYCSILDRRKKSLLAPKLVQALHKAVLEHPSLGPVATFVLTQRCLSCNQHQTKCDRQLPCSCCKRYQRGTYQSQHLNEHSSFQTSRLYIPNA